MTKIDSNIIYGGDSTDFEEKLGNLGDFILSKLNEFNDEIAMVSSFIFILLLLNLFTTSD